MVRLRGAAAASVFVAVLMLAAACAGAGQRPARTGPTLGGPLAGQLTIAGARQAFSAFLPRFMRLRREYSAAAARSLTVGTELATQLFSRGQSGLPVKPLTRLAFYVPRLAGYPRWFLAAGQQAGSNPAGRLFVMVQSAQSAPWKASMALFDLRSAAGMLHQLASTVTTDAQGYAEVVPPDDPSLDAPPAAMSATYASYLDGTASPVVRRLFQAGPSTTGYLSFVRQLARGAGRYGWRDTDHQAPTRSPVYALRLDTGGAIVIFATRDMVGWLARSSSARLRARPSARAATYLPPTFVVQALRINSVQPGMRLEVNAFDRVLAFVQPKGVGFIYPLINNGAATGVRESNSPG